MSRAIDARKTEANPSSAQENTSWIVSLSMTLRQPTSDEAMGHLEGWFARSLTR